MRQEKLPSFVRSCRNVIPVVYMLLISEAAETNYNLLSYVNDQFNIPEV